ncbi:hypothetical protein D8864_05730 [Streptococcus oralis]|nr:hypothetical protein D8864_05730 [Streptococcus oralis]
MFALVWSVILTIPHDITLVQQAEAIIILKKSHKFFARLIIAILLLQANRNGHLSFLQHQVIVVTSNAWNIRNNNFSVVSKIILLLHNTCQDSTFWTRRMVTHNLQTIVKRVCQHNVLLKLIRNVIEVVIYCISKCFVFGRQVSRIGWFFSQLKWIFNGTSIITLILVYNFLSSTWVTVF